MSFLTVDELLLYYPDSDVTSYQKVGIYIDLILTGGIHVRTLDCDTVQLYIEQGQPLKVPSLEVLAEEEEEEEIDNHQKQYNYHDALKITDQVYDNIQPGQPLKAPAGIKISDEATSALLESLRRIKEPVTRNFSSWRTIDGLNKIKRFIKSLSCDSSLSISHKQLRKRKRKRAQSRRGVFFSL